MFGLGKAPSENMLFSRQDVVRIFVPIIFEQFLAMLVGMADSVMVAGVGVTAVSAVSLVDQISILLINLFGALATGGAVVAGQCLGRRDTREACHISDQLMIVLALISVVITGVLFAFTEPLLKLIFGSVEPQVMTYAKTYLKITSLSLPFIAIYNAAAAIFRTMSDSRTPMLISILMNCINIGGNALLIYGFGLKIEGAAIPTLVSRISAAVMGLILLRNPHRMLHFSRPFKFRLDTGAVKRILAIGVPSGIENSMFQFGKLIVVGMIAGFGTASIAANAVGNAVGAFQVLPGSAMGMTCVPIVARCYGAGEGKQVRYYAGRLITLAYIFNVAINVIIALLVPFIIKAYHLDSETANIARWVLLFSGAVSATLWPGSFSLPNAFRATGDVKYPMVISVVSMWIWRVGSSWLLGVKLGLGLHGVWYGMALDWTFRTTFYWLRFCGKTWGRRIGIRA